MPNWYPQHTPEAGKPWQQEIFSDEFPRLLYRDAEPANEDALPFDSKERRAELDRQAMTHVQGHRVETLLVESAAEEVRALEEGWRRNVAPPSTDEPLRRGPGRPRTVVAEA